MAGSRPSSAGVRLAPLRRMSSVRDVRDDAAERVLAGAHANSASALELLVALSEERRAHVGESLGQRPKCEDAERERLRVSAREELTALLAAMRRRCESDVTEDATRATWPLLDWLVNLPSALAANESCRASVSLKREDIAWLLRKGIAALSVLLAGEDDQRAHAVRRGVLVEEMDGYLERVGCLREGFAPSPANDWLQSYVAARVHPHDLAEHLLALYLYTANCRSRAVVEGWEQSADDEWSPPPVPARCDVHGPNGSPWAVMNWTLRTAHDPTQSDDVRRAAAESLACFALLRDRIDEALFVLPKERDVVFRGVNLPGLSYRYTLSHPVVFPPFTSTSTQGEEARGYAKESGTFFVIRSHSAARIDFVSHVPAEAEKLLPSFSRFSVLQKASNTILRMLECPYDIVTLAEHGDGDCSEQEAADGFLRSIRQTRFIYSAYLRDTYVEGRVAVFPPPALATTMLFESVDAWIANAGHLLLLGTGGSGKTSAALAVHSIFSLNDAEFAPVLVPLPSVRDVFAPGAIDAHVRELLRMTPSQVEHLFSVRTVVIVLESLDEVAVPSDGGARSALTGLLHSNPLVARARVLLTCRDEFLSSHAVQPADVFGDEGHVLYLHPFSPDDASACISKFCVRAKMSQEEAEEKWRCIATLSAGMGAAIYNPCVLQLACSVANDRVQDIVRTTAGRIPPSSLYEAFVTQQVGGDATTLAGMQHVALSMLSGGAWLTTVGDVFHAFESLGVHEDAFRALHLPRIPRRVETDADFASVFAWWHKSVGEFLAARAFWSSASESLTLVGRSFSLAEPAVLQFFGGMAVENPSQRDALCEDVLLPCVRMSRLHVADPDTIVPASNALALACVSDFAMLGQDLSSITVESANLESACFHGVDLSNATLRGCRLHQATFDRANIRGARFPHCSCELSVPPFRGHRANVQSVCVSPNGKVIASGSRDTVGGIRLWDAATGTEVRALDGHTHTVRCVRFSRDGKLLLSASADKTLRVWDVDSGTEVFTMSGHTRAVNCVCLSPHGSIVASASDDHTVRLWSMLEAEEVRKFEGHSGAVLAVRFSPDGSRVASASNDKTVRLWDVQTGADSQLFIHEHPVNSVDFSPDGLLVASGSYDKTVRLWDVATGNELRVLEHTHPVNAVSFSPDGRLVASGSRDSMVHLWDAATAHEVRTFRGHVDSVSSVCFTPDGASLVSGSDDGTVRLWDATMRQGLRAGEGHTGTVRGVCFSSDGRRIVSWSSDKMVGVWDARTAKEVHALKGHTNIVNGACVSPDCSVVASVSYDRTLRFWDAAAGAQARLMQLPMQADFVGYSPDARFLVFNAADAVRVLEVATGTDAWVLQGHKHAVRCAAFSPTDPTLLATCAFDGRARLWDLSTGECVRDIAAHTAVAWCVCFTPDGNQLVTCSDDKSVRLWDVASGELVRAFEGHTGGVHSVSVAHGGRVVASGSNDRTVRIWDVATGECLQTLAGHSGPVVAVCFSPDGTLLATGADDHCVCVWGVAPPTSPAVAVDSVHGSAPHFKLRHLIWRASQLSAALCEGPPDECEGTSPALLSCLVPGK